MSRTTLVLTLLLGSGSTCPVPGSGESQPPPGLAGASSDPTPGFQRPVSTLDRAEVTRRGRLLHDMQRSVGLAVAAATGAGSAGSDLVFPLVQIDPGARSGQVVFIRWMDEDVPDASKLKVARARRWLLVSLDLRPDRVVDVEPLTGYVTEGTKEGVTLEAVVVARQTLANRAPGETFRFHVVFEEAPPPPDRTHPVTQARVYAFGQGDNAPDYELLLRRGKRRRAGLELTTLTRVHAPATRAQDWVRTETHHVTPLTVARVLGRGNRAGVLEVETTSGSMSVDAETGKISASPRS